MYNLMKWKKLKHSSFNLQAAGVTKPASEICPSVAEEALDQLMIRISSVERELQDFKFKVYPIYKLKYYNFNLSCLFNL